MVDVQVIAHTTGGEISSKWAILTEEEVLEVRESFQRILTGGKIDYLDLDTDTGWVVIPGDQILYIEAKVEAVNV